MRRIFPFAERMEFKPHLPNLGCLIEHIFTKQNCNNTCIVFLIVDIFWNCLVTFGPQDLSRTIERNENKNVGQGNIKNHHTKCQWINFHRLLTFLTFLNICCAICIQYVYIWMQYEYSMQKSIASGCSIASGGPTLWKKAHFYSKHVVRV